MKVSELMTSPAVSVQTATPVSDVVQLLVQHRIGSIPVTGDDGCIVGLITETDLFPQLRGIPFSTMSAPNLFHEWVSPEFLPELYERSRGLSAGDVMTRPVNAIGPDADAAEAIRIMLESGCRHVPVVSNGEVVGMLTRHDVLRAFCLTLTQQRSAGYDRCQTVLPEN